MRGAGTIRRFFGCALAGFLALGCGGTASRVEREALYVPLEAEGFFLSKEKGGVVLTVTDPWQGAKRVDYELFMPYDTASPPAGFKGVALKGPAKRIVCMSSSYVGFLDALGKTGAIAGVSGADYLMGESIRARIERGEVRDVGYDKMIDYEAIASLDPDLMLLYGVFGENLAVTDKLGELGIPYMYIGDYVETSPLGKAEWIVALGQIVGMREEAQEFFSAVRERYMASKERVAGVSERPAAMLNAPWQSVWYVPGDKSYMVSLINDAGGRYLFEGSDSRNVRAVSIEEAYLAAQDADIWLCPNQAVTLAELGRENPRFMEIPAVKSGRVFNNNARCSSKGGSDFWESGAARPDVILDDMIGIFHPELAAGGQGAELRQQGDSVSGPAREFYYFWRLE